MTADAASIALNLLALLATAVYVLVQSPAQGPSPLDRRLGAMLSVVMSLVAVRSARWWFDAELLRRIEEALAASLPLFALVLAEGLLRRHAPAWLKLAISGGSFVLATAALARPEQAAGLFAYGLGAFVSLALLCVAFFLASRDRLTLARTENDVIGAMFVALVVALPLGATDFLAAAGASPIRAGGLGLLFFLVAVARISAIGGGAGGVLREFAGACAAAIIGYAAFVFAFGAPIPAQTLSAPALMLAFVLALRSMQYPLVQRAVRARTSLWRALAEAPSDTRDDFVDGMLRAPELRNAHVLEGAALSGYEPGAILAAFDAGSVLNEAATRRHEQLSVLMDENEATHVVLLSKAPLALLFVTLPRVGAGADVELQLRVLAKLARQASHA